MKETQFIDRRRGEWESWDHWLAQTSGRKKKDQRQQQPATPARPLLAEDLPGSFRRLSRDLALARDRRYSAPLVEALHQRVLAAHQRIYGAVPAHGNSVIGFLAGGFPAIVRKEWKFVLAATLMFFVPLILLIVVLQYRPEAVYLFLSPDQTSEFQDMYAPSAAHLGRPREASSAWAMWGFYIANNVRIDFQCFASGIVFGIGAVIYLIYNGLVIGSVAGYLTHLGYVETFWGFVAGHSAFELTGAVLSGAAGLKIGYALIAPGRYSRATALKQAGSGAARLLAGAALLTFSAAFIEAFWSPGRSVPVEIKYGVGIVLWLLTWGYLLLIGKGQGED